MLISVIVPVYNVEKYLQRCVESILAQTYDRLEILLIDDGSTDSSGFICDAFGKKDKRIRVFHKENGGVSSARNLGIANATGDYICFVDSDDWLDVDYFAQAVVLLLKEHPVLLMNNYVKDDGEGHIFNKFFPTPIIHFDAAEAFYEMAKGFYFGWEPVASFYEATGCKKVKFNSQIVYGEDLLFRFQFTQVNKGSYVYQYLPGYHYFTRVDSAVNSYGIYKKVDDLKVFEQIMNETMPQTKQLLLVQDYIPRLVQYCSHGLCSHDRRDILSAKEIQSKIRVDICRFCKINISIFIKLKLVVCLLPTPLLQYLHYFYDSLKTYRGKKW